MDPEIEEVEVPEETEKVEEQEPQKPENVEIEDRYRLTFLQMDKRFINLELAIGDLSEKIKGLKSVDSETINAVQERLDDLEDLTMVENLGGLELKKTLDSINSQIADLSKRTASVSPEEIQKVEASILQKVNERVSSLPPAPLNQTGLQEEIARLNERTKNLETGVIQKIVSEISDLRTETSKEIRNLNDQISGIGATKSDIDIKFLSSRLNSLKDSVEFMLNRKAETDIKLENLQKALSQIALKVEQTSIEKTPSEIPPVEQKLSESGPREFESEPREEESSAFLSTDIGNLLEKIARLENKIKMMEKEVQKSTKSGPMVLE